MLGVQTILELEWNLSGRADDEQIVWQLVGIDRARSLPKRGAELATRLLRDVFVLTLLRVSLFYEWSEMSAHCGRDIGMIDHSPARFCQVERALSFYQSKYAKLV